MPDICDIVDHQCARPGATVMAPAAWKEPPAGQLPPRRAATTTGRAE